MSLFHDIYSSFLLFGTSDVCSIMFESFQTKERQKEREISLWRITETDMEPEDGETGIAIAESFFI